MCPSGHCGAADCVRTVCNRGSSQAKDAYRGNGVGQTRSMWRYVALSGGIPNQQAAYSDAQLLPGLGCDGAPPVSRCPLEVRQHGSRELREACNRVGGPGETSPRGDDGGRGTRCGGVSSLREACARSDPDPLGIMCASRTDSSQYTWRQAFTRRLGRSRRVRPRSSSGSRRGHRPRSPCRAPGSLPASAPASPRGGHSRAGC
jgi:hypothetical protein